MMFPNKQKELVRQLRQELRRERARNVLLTEILHRVEKKHLEAAHKIGNLRAAHLEELLFTKEK